MTQDNVNKVLFVRAKVFCRLDEDEAKIKSALRTFLPYTEEELAKEKIGIALTKVELHLGEPMKIFSFELSKQRHIRRFIVDFFSKLTQESKKLLFEQAESRLDDELNFFIRLDKHSLLSGERKVCDHGDCFHLSLTIAAYPANREKAISVVESLLS